MVTFVPPPFQLTAANLGPILAATAKKDTDTSSSGVAGTEVVEIAAAAGNILLAIQGDFKQSASATSQVIVTYTDDTTTTILLGSATDLSLNNAGAMGGSATYTALAAKDIKKVRYETTGAGVTARYGNLTCLEVTP